MKTDQLVKHLNKYALFTHFAESRLLPIEAEYLGKRGHGRDKKEALINLANIIAGCTPPGLVMIKHSRGAK